MKYTKYISTLLISTCLIAGLTLHPQAASAQNGTSFETNEGWGINVNGAIPVFLNLSAHDEFSADGEDQLATRVMSGFNPANVTFTVNAPTQDGINVSAVFQINYHLHGPSVQNAGLFEARIADIVISGDFGTINAGKGFGIFNSISIGDEGSGMGIGRFGGPDAADATLGRIGSGYTYANFNPRITYTTPDVGGFTAKVGLINPEKPGGPSPNTETAGPRIEGQIDYVFDLGRGSLQTWGGGLYQSVSIADPDFDFNISGWDTGLKLNIAGLKLTGSYSETKSIGADGLIGINISGGDALDQADIDGAQWYTEATYDFGGLLLGASYGEGSQNANATAVGSADDVTNELLMGFARYDITDNLTWIGEVQNFASEAQDDYQALILGLQLNF